jgi:hypothetical protein
MASDNKIPGAIEGIIVIITIILIYNYHHYHQGFFPVMSFTVENLLVMIAS